MKTKSIPVRSCRNSLAPYPSLPESFGSGEIVRDTCDEDQRLVPHKKRHCLLGTDSVVTEPLTSDACIVCGVSDMLVFRCSGIDCLVRFHEECLTPEFGGNEDLENPFCPYCWFKFVAVKSESWRDKATRAEEAVSKYLDKDIASDHGLQGENADCSSQEDRVPVDKDSEQPEEDGGKLQLCTTVVKEDRVIDDEVEASAEDEEMEAMVATDNFQEAEGDDESSEVPTKVNTDVSLFLTIQESYSGKEVDQDQQNEKQIRRRVEMNDTDSEISLTKERNGKTVRDLSFFNKDQRRRVLWTSEEAEMLRVGVEKFAGEANKNMPWRKILEMGEDVFHETRTPANLKDKWRNMLKALH